MKPRGFFEGDAALILRSGTSGRITSEGHCEFSAYKRGYAQYLREKLCPARPKQFGLFLCQMHETPDLVVRDADGKEQQSVHENDLNTPKAPSKNNFEEGNQVAGSEKLRIKIKGYEHATVDAAAAKIVEAAKRGGAQKVSGPIPLPTDKEIVTILRAVHKYKDSREQFELRTHKRLIDVIRPTKATMDALTKLEIPAGVDIDMELK